jgi:thiamine-phosphate pyrophosphorylase
VKLIVITKPNYFEGEVKLLVQLLEEGADFIHVRKPHKNVSVIAELISQIPVEYHERIKVHYFKEVLDQYSQVNFHHSKTSCFQEGLSAEQSKSNHELEQLKLGSNYQYQFISPVFDSISKQGYQSKFSVEQLSVFLRLNNIKNAVALGGVSLTNMKTLAESGFYGVAVLGDLWKQPKKTLITHFKEIKKEIS